MQYPIRLAASVVAAMALAACASLPPERGYAETSAAVEARLGIAPTYRPGPAAAGSTAEADVPTKPLSVDDAIRIAFIHNPRMQEVYARIGLSRAELEDARRVSNPTLGYAKLDPRTGPGAQITRSLSLGFSELLLLPARKRFATAELARIQNVVAAELLVLATDVETAWYTSVGATLVAQMRDAVATSAQASAELAQRFFDAGNINRLQLEQERAASVRARIDAVRADAEADRARSQLANLLGVPSHGAWSTLQQLPSPPVIEMDTEALVDLARSQRLDLVAARQSVTQREDALGVTRRWRWLGSIDIGYEREEEVDGSEIRGPTLALALPIFNQGQGALARARAELLSARSELDALTLSVQNGTRLALDQLRLSHDIAERYRTALLPSREAIVARSQEQTNFMLMGVFELIRAKQDEYDAYQEYLEAVRDYWIARAELKQQIGGELPDDASDRPGTIGVEAILPAAEMPPMDHSMHGMKPAESSDPHAGHQMPTTAPEDPHAGHKMAPSDETEEDAAEADPDTHSTHEHGDTP